MNSKAIVIWTPMIIAAAIALALLAVPAKQQGDAVQQPKRADDTESSREHVTNPESFTATTTSRHGAAPQDMQPMSERVQNLQRYIEAMKRQGGTTEPVAAQAGGGDPEAMERERTTQTTAFLESNFVSETKDPTWSLQAERQLSDTF